MVMRVHTGLGTVEDGKGETKGKNGGQSPNSRELANMVASESHNSRLAALLQMMNIPRALAYVAATSPHQDMKDAAMERLFRDPDALYKILDGMTNRSPLPWERGLVRIVEEKLEYSGDARIAKLKAWQLNRSPAFGAFVKCNGEGNSTVEYMDESPMQFDPDDLQKILEAS